MQMEQAVELAPTAAPAEVISLPQPAAVRPLKICLLGYRSHPYGGGQGIYIKYLSKALLEAGHQVDVVSGPPYPDLDPGVRLIKLPSMNLYETGLLSIRPHHLTSWANIIEWMSKLLGGFAEPQAFGRRAVAYLREHGRHYDIVHDNQCLAFGMLRLQQLGFPLVTTVHHPITQDLELALRAAPGWRGWYRRLLIRRWHSFVYMQKYVIARLQHLVTVSRRSRQDITSDFGIAPERVELVFNGIDTQVFKPMPEVSRQARLLMATASADQPLKGLRYLLQAYARLLPDYPDLQLLVVGKPQPGGQTERLLQRLQISDKVQFVHGISTEQLVTYYNQATMAIVPSLYEGFGLPAGEAMACATPLVASDGGALPEVVGDAGLVVPAGNAEALRAAIAGLLVDPQARQRLGELGRQRIEQQFSWRLVAQQMTAFYYRVIDGNR